MKRFEVTAAWALGAALPILEACRRRTDFSNLPAYVDDFLAGGLLLWAAWSMHRGRPQGPGLLVAAWGIVVGGAYYSFFGQLARIGDVDISGIAGAWVVAFKGVLFAVAILSLVCSVKRVRTGR